MLKKLHLLLIQVVVAGCLLPAGILFKGGLTEMLSRRRQFFQSILADHSSILGRVASHSRIMRALVKSSLSIAIVLHRTHSFKQTARHIFRVLGGAPAFLGTSTANSQVPPMRATKGDLCYEYVDFVTARATQDVSSDFVPLMKTASQNVDDVDIKLIAFYLPQFHAFPLNDEWYGKGFTEWTNVTKAIPQYTGHYQPQLPIDMGYYNLDDISVMYRQVELAQMYGIHAFCFHYYWFSGTRLMDKPIFKWLEHKDIDFRFCLNWANENWSKLWDGGDREVRYKQELRPGDDERFFTDILPFLQDSRYITVRGKPLLLIYRPHLFPQERCRRFMQTLQEKAVNHGFPGLYIVSVNSHGFRENPNLWGLDAMAEFPPHGMLDHGLQEKSLDCFVNPYFDGHIWDGTEYVRQKRYLYEAEYKLFKGVSPSWDNTPRKAYSNGSVIDGITPAIYKEWLSGCIDYTRKHHAEDERFIFINAWNEWAEGAHLEPDSRYGYAYLQATQDALMREEL